jgi:hypothetical protein
MSPMNIEAENNAERVSTTIVLVSGLDSGHLASAISASPVENFALIADYWLQEPTLADVAR